MTGTFMEKKKVLQLVKEVPTRWNSKYQCYIRLTQLRPALHEYFKLLCKGNPKQRQQASAIMLQEIDWQDLEQVIDTLSAYKDASIALEVQKEIISHMVLVVLKNLLAVDPRTTAYEVGSLKAAFCENASKYLVNAYLEGAFWLEFSVAAYLDPR